MSININSVDNEEALIETLHISLAVHHKLHLAKELK